MSNLDKKVSLMCAMRYSLGRMTYVVSSVVNEILDNWDLFLTSDIRTIKQEIFDAINDSSAGMDMDVKQWCRILDKGCGEKSSLGNKCTEGWLCEYCTYNLKKLSKVYYVDGEGNECRIPKTTEDNE